MTAASSTPVAQSAAKRPLPAPTAAQQLVLNRIAAQRERLRARRAAHAQSQALAAQQRAGELGSADDPLLLRAAAFARAHPLAVAAMAGRASWRPPTTTPRSSRFSTMSAPAATTASRGRGVVSRPSGAPAGITPRRRASERAPWRR